MNKIIGISLMLVIGLAFGSTASAEASAYEGGHKTWCYDDAYRSVKGLNAAKGTSCGTAYKVLDRWMNNDGLEGQTKIRVGDDGVLWTCYGSRAYGKMNPWYISCNSSQKIWHYNKRYGSWYSFKYVWFQYRTDR